MNAPSSTLPWNAVPESMLWTPEELMLSAWSEHVPFAFWIIDVLRPRTLVELGTHRGMSYLAFCQAIKKLGTGTTAMAVDSWEGDSQAGAYGSKVLTTLRGMHDAKYSSFSKLNQAYFDDAAKQVEDGTIDLCHIDGLHTYEAVKNDFETWLPKMSDRGVMLFHDTVERISDFGVYRLWAELEQRYPNSHFEFHHEHGLGVLGVGSGGFPPALQGLFDTSKDAAQADHARTLFSRLGERISALYTVDRQEKSLNQVRNFPGMKGVLKLRQALSA